MHSVITRSVLRQVEKNIRIFCPMAENTARSHRSAAVNQVNGSVTVPGDFVLPNDLSTQTLKGITFDNYVDSFGNKSTWEIVRAITVLQLCSFEAVAENSLELMKWMQSIVGVRGLRLLCKPTIYNQFVGGEDSEELRACTRKLAQTGMRAMLAASLEEDVGERRGELVHNNNCQRILDAINIITTEDTKAPMIQLKLSGLLSADLLVTIGNFYEKSDNKLKLITTLAEGMSTGKINKNLFGGLLDENDISCLERAIERFKKIGIEAKKKKVKVLVDAEYTYMNTGLSFLALAAVAVFNKDASVIWNTYQCYLKDTERALKEELNFAKEMGCHFGAKLVRGAYMSQERDRAKKLCIPDPVCDNYAATCDSYNRILTFLVEQHSLVGLQCQFIIASHNEESIKLAVKKMEELEINKEAGAICFGQLYGMCDQVSNPLMKVGLPVYKSIPYGRMDEVLPYLARRAVENKSVFDGARKELSLLKKELRRRIENKIYLTSK